MRDKTKNDHNKSPDCLPSERPLSGPVMSGLEGEYRQGGLLNLSCSAAPGRPPPHIGWTINNQEVSIMVTENGLNYFVDGKWFNYFGDGKWFELFW